MLEAHATDDARDDRTQDLPAFVSVELTSDEELDKAVEALSVTLPNGLRIDGIILATVSTVAALISAQ